LKWGVNEWRESDLFFFEVFLYNNADKTEKSGRHPNTTQRREIKREMEVNSIMDGSEKKKREHHQLLFSLLILLKEWWERQKMTYSKATTANRMYVCITDDKCVSYWYKLKYRKNSQEALVYNYSDESLVQCRYRCPKALYSLILSICEQIRSFFTSSYVMYCVG